MELGMHLDVAVRTKQIATIQFGFDSLPRTGVALGGNPERFASVAGVKRQRLNAPHVTTPRPRAPLYSTALRFRSLRRRLTKNFSLHAAVQKRRCRPTRVLPHRCHAHLRSTAGCSTVELSGKTTIAEIIRERPGLATAVPIAPGLCRPSSQKIDKLSPCFVVLC